MNPAAPRSFRSYRKPMSIGLALAVATAVGLSFAAPAGAATDVALGPVASTYGVLSGVGGVTNTGATTVSGSVGDSPAGSIGGFPPGVISHGTKQDNTGNAATAQGEVTSAYVRAAAEPTTSTRSVIGTGETLDAGVYTAGSTLEVSGSLTLDGENNPNAIFVFKAGSALNVDGGSTINLINGANDCNIYWQVTSSATVNTTANFHGTILALTSITALHDATVHGRLLARNGTVTLDDDHILVPDCTTGGGGSGSSGPSSTATSTTTPGASSTTAPTTEGITPRNGPTGGGTVVRLTGTGYVPGGTTVTVGGQKIPTSGVHVTSKTHLHFTMPAHGTGRVNVVVHTAGGTSQRAVFTYLATGVTSSAAGTTTTSLASTGAPVGALSGLAALLLLGGTAVLFVSRRRIGPKHHR